MFLLIVIFLLILSVLMAFGSLSKQNKLDEISQVKKSLRQRRVIFYKDFSDFSEKA